jgi:hypothetical protein
MLSKGINIRRFLRAAEQRLASAHVLYNAGMFLECVYLAGYSVECGMKAVILSQIPLHKRPKFMQEYFRGSIAHDYEYLKSLLREKQIHMPSGIVSHLRNVVTWSTDLRYEVGQIKSTEAIRFLSSVTEILNWAKGRSSP